MFSLIMNLIGCASACQLYRDYCHRVILQKDLDQNKFPIFQGRLSLEKTNQNHKEWNRPNILPLHPFHTIDIHTRTNVYTWYPDVTLHNKHHYHIDTLWHQKNIWNYVAPKIKFNDININLNDAHINYTHHRVQRIGSNQYISEYYIPENTLVSILGSQLNDQYYVKFIGTQQSVIDNIAYYYYGISDKTTIVTIGIFGFYLMWVGCQFW